MLGVVILLSAARPVRAGNNTESTNLFEVDQGRTVQGIAADGVAQVVVIIPANNVGDQFLLTVLNDSSQTQSTLPNEDGALGNPGDTSFSQTQLNITAVATSNDASNPNPMAFAVYGSHRFRAPVFRRELQDWYLQWRIGDRRPGRLPHGYDYGSESNDGADRQYPGSHPATARCPYSRAVGFLVRLGQI
jgi:hypothetical protein